MSVTLKAGHTLGNMSLNMSRNKHVAQHIPPVYGKMFHVSGVLQHVPEYRTCSIVGDMLQNIGFQFLVSVSLGQ